MRVIFVGTLPPPGGDAAFRFGRAAALRAMAGDVVETHAPDVLSVAHKNLRFGPRTLARHLRNESGKFDAVVLRVGTSLPFGTENALIGNRRRAGALVRALRGYSEVSMFADPGVASLDKLFRPSVTPLWRVATAITVANELDRAAFVDRGGVPPEVVSVVADTQFRSDVVTPWPTTGDTALASSVSGAIRQRSQSSTVAPMLLMSVTGRARPSLKGASVWLVRRVIGKSRGWVTRLLRP
jgi:hypothetical protein